MKNYYPTFVVEGAKMIKRENPNRIKHTENFGTDFRSLYGCSPIVYATIWVKCRFNIKKIITETFIMGINVFKIV